MIIGNSIASNYPFTRSSTLAFSKHGIKLSPDRVLAAKLYPKVEKPTLLRISSMEKAREQVKMNISDSADNKVAVIYFPLTEDCEFGNIKQHEGVGCVGYAIQEEELCGCIIGDDLLLKLLKASPSTEFDSDAFIFSPSVCFLRMSPTERTGKLLFDDKVVRDINFVSSSGGTIIGDANSGYTINTESLSYSEPIKTVKGIIVNEKHLLGSNGETNIYIKSYKDSGIRVITESNGIRIGRLSEL